MLRLEGVVRRRCMVRSGSVVCTVCRAEGVDIGKPLDASVRPASRPPLSFPVLEGFVASRITT
jgi:hypothetical protein